MTEEQIKALIAEQLKSAFSGDAFKQAVTGEIKGAVTTGITEAIGGLDIAGTVKQALEANKGSEEGTGNQAGGESKDPDPVVAAKLAALERQLQAEKSARETAENASRTERLLNATRAELGKAGIAPDRIEHAIAVLHHAGGRLKTTESGEPVISMSRDWGKEDVPLNKGIGEWAKAEGLHFLPPKEATGTGGGGSHHDPTIPKTGDGKLDVSALRDRVGSALSRAPDLEA